VVDSSFEFAVFWAEVDVPLLMPTEEVLHQPGPVEEVNAE
jgi:hypothetical protein